VGGGNILKMFICCSQFETYEKNDKKALYGAQAKSSRLITLEFTIMPII
jgi:hypothetical protein